MSNELNTAQKQVTAADQSTVYSEGSGIDRSAVSTGNSGFDRSAVYTGNSVIDPSAVCARGSHIVGPVHAGARVYVAPGACLMGQIILGEDSSVWCNASIRGDQSEIRIGARSNIQDNCVLHVDQTKPLRLGEDVSVGHGAILHSCTIGDHTLIGMGSILLNHVQIGRDCLIGAGSLLTEGMVVPDGHLVYGHPARVRRALSEEEILNLSDNVEKYLRLARLGREAEAAHSENSSAQVGESLREAGSCDCRPDGEAN